jgi:hypothetical protein
MDKTCKCISTLGTTVQASFFSLCPYNWMVINPGRNQNLPLLLLGCLGLRRGCRGLQETLWPKSSLTHNMRWERNMVPLAIPFYCPQEFLCFLTIKKTNLVDGKKVLRHDVTVINSIVVRCSGGNYNLIVGFFKCGPKSTVNATVNPHCWNWSLIQLLD